MRKIVIICTFILAAMPTVFAQQFRFGLTASPMFDWLSVDGTKSENDGTRIGFQYGLLFDQTIGNVQRYAFSSGLLINYANTSFNYTDTLPSLNTTFRVQYIEIPVTIRLRTNEVNYVTYYGQFGVTPGFTIKGRGDFTFDPGDSTHISIEDVNVLTSNPTGIKYNPINMNLTLGAGLEYGISENTAIIAGVFFQNGFTNVLNDDVDDDNSRLKQIGIRLGVLF